MASSLLSYQDAVRELDARGQGIRPDLGRIRALVDLLDHPERTYPSIQVTGTNGKSSTVRMIGRILAAHGLKSGLYSSPRLQSIRECFVVADELSTDLISQEDFAATLRYLKPFVEMVELQRDEDVTSFELLTAMAFEWMAQQTVAAGVFEVGLGGAWDATNVVEGQVAAITRVAVDHERFLGATPLDNAREKVGIVKPGARVVSADQDPEVLSLIERTVSEAGGELALLGRDFAVASNKLAVSGRALVVRGMHDRYEELFVPMHGSHQGANAAVAVAACEAFLGRALDPEALRAGLARASLPGRMEVVSRQPLVVLDGAHNPAASRLLGPALREAFGQPRATFVISIFEDKDAEGVLGWLLPWADRVAFAPSSSPRSTDPAHLAALAEAIAARAGVPAGPAPASGESAPAPGGSSPAGTVHGGPNGVVNGAAARLEVQVAGSIEAAVDAVLATSEPDDMVVVCGSLHAVGQVRNHLVGALD
ncbi:MAG TPA: cyanophycin synthetase [Actinomycetota bacterium]